MTPDAYIAALAEVGKLIVKAGVVLDRLDVGGGFPSIYSEAAPAPLSAFIRAINADLPRTKSRSVSCACARASLRCDCRPVARFSQDGPVWSKK